MTTATVTSKGQITIPLAVRQRLNLEVGDRVEFVELPEGGFALKPAIDDISALKGLLKKPSKPVTLDTMRAVIRKRGSRR